jgi:hypothetical protein
MALSKMISMELDDEDKLDAVMPIAMPSKPDYPFGLQICLTHAEIEKLGIDHLEKGEIVHIRAMGKVTFAQQSEGEHGHACRCEVQIQHMSLENESREGADEDDEPKPRSKLYRK